ncbi:hypothetical protein CTEN210_12147 [Chaetoceros tenuissimus]|uniref:Uncharacterized protein n=1 Tax=Chaetoceros tenuissimus TaxID=426638 RepID=A0AAD3D2N3_9STRA|nr:hypothetical protein CTEN210_12147 [Chaetoceros tenuissimus]
MDHRVKFDPANHFQTLFQLHGSVWSSVLPFCIANVANLYAVAYVKTNLFGSEEDPLVLGISLDDFQSTISIVISFLAVTRLGIAVDAYLRQRAAAQTMIRACRSLIFHSVAFTRHDKSETAKKWRLDIAS